MRLQSVAARVAFVAFLLAALAGAAAAGGARLGYWDVDRGYHLLLPSIALGMLALAAGLVWLVLALKRNSGAGKRLGFIGLLGAILLLYQPAVFAWHMLTMPAIGDAATDPEHPPQFVVLRRDDPSADDSTRQIRFHGETLSIASMLHDYYPEVTKPYALLITPDKMFWRGFETAKSMGWNIVSFDAKAGRIEAVATSLWFGRKTDIAIQTRRAGTLGARLDIRCKSLDAAPDGGHAILCVQGYLRELARR